MDEPALPELTTEVARKPNWSAAATAVGEERSFTVPVGFAALELDLEPPHPEPAAERRAVEQRALALAEGHAMGGVGDGQHRRVAPEAAAREDAGPRAGAAPPSRRRARGGRGRPAHSSR